MNRSAWAASAAARQFDKHFMGASGTSRGRPGVTNFSACKSWPCTWPGGQGFGAQTAAPAGTGLDMGNLW